MKQVCKKCNGSGQTKSHPASSTTTLPCSMCGGQGWFYNPLNIKSIFQEILELCKNVPEEELDKLPKDGAKNHDHYIYGTPKKYNEDGTPKEHISEKIEEISRRIKDVKIKIEEEYRWLSNFKREESLNKNYLRGKADGLKLSLEIINSNPNVSLTIDKSLEKVESSEKPTKSEVEIKIRELEGRISSLEGFRRTVAEHQHLIDERWTSEMGIQGKSKPKMLRKRLKPKPTEESLKAAMSDPDFVADNAEIMKDFEEADNQLYNQELCSNCCEPDDGDCACMRNKCIKCGKPVGNITFTYCDDCFDKK